MNTTTAPRVVLIGGPLDGDVWPSDTPPTPHLDARPGSHWHRYVAAGLDDRGRRVYRYQGPTPAPLEVSV